MISGTTRLVGLMGWPVSHSLSPIMHNAAFEHLNMDWKYVPLPVHPDLVGAAVAGLQGLGFVGANVTVPHKTAVLSHLDALSGDAQQIGAVNTLVLQANDDGTRLLEGDNTDCVGFLNSLQRAAIPVANERVLVYGAGGSARAVVFGLLSSGVKQVMLLNRHVETAQALADQFGALAHGRIHVLQATHEALIEFAPSASLLVNATPVGMSPHVEASIWPEGKSMPQHLSVVDLIYAPIQTQLIRQARKSGAQTLGGLSMLVEQGAAAFSIWTGEQAPVVIMQEACEQHIQGGRS